MSNKIKIAFNKVGSFGLSQRKGQEEMACEVASVISRGGVLLVEAGPGTGKSLAYLIPVFLSGARVVVSTATKNLQGQLISKDIPLASLISGTNPAACVLKGRENYLCIERFKSFAKRGQENLFYDQATDEIFKWASYTHTGDIEEIRGLSKYSRPLHELIMPGPLCKGPKCKYFKDCFVQKIRAKARASDVVIVNHALLMNDLIAGGDGSSLLCDNDILVLDEAHRIPDIATYHLGIRVSLAEVQSFFNEVAIELKVGLPRRVYSLAEDRNNRCALDDNTLSVLDNIILDVDGLIHRLQSVSGGGMDPQKDLIEWGEDIISRCETIKTTSSQAWVRFVDIQTSNMVFNLSPVDVSNVLPELLFYKQHATILTSATLTTRNGFDSLTRRIGLGKDDVKEVVVKSPFDYESNTRLFIPESLPEPGDDRFITAAPSLIIRLIRANKGKALILFTSYARLQIISDIVINQVSDYPIYVQGMQSNTELLNRFRDEEDSILFATGAFWEGIDVEGRSLSLLIIDKIPFAVPDDPIIRARYNLANQQGLNPFEEVQLDHAILILKQGLGRLIRSERDRGALVILDSRIFNRSYGKVILNALSRYTLVRSLKEIENFLQYQTSS
ncbi:MAG: ATP-dependent DNA helicase [Deltaproteobacteria bacterium]|nr:ATP-dependent DNA helicase [Deltaproteobacteria bacterium]